MSTRNDALRSVHVRTIFAVMAAAFFPQSGSAFRRLASSSKKAFVKYWTMDAPLRPRSWPTRKSLGSYESRIETGKVLRTADSARARVGSQARSKARDSRTLPEGVPRFESWPTHRISPGRRGLRRSHTRRRGCESQGTSPARTAGPSRVCSLEIHQCSAASVHAALVFFRDTM